MQSNVLVCMRQPQHAFGIVRHKPQTAEYVEQQGADLVNQSVEQSQVSRALKEAIPPACEVLIYASPRKYLPLRLTSVTSLSHLLDSTGASESFEQSVLSLPMRQD